MTPNNRSLPLAATLLAAATILLSGRADATLVKTASFDDKVDNAAAIVLGKVVKQESRFDASHRWILTYTTFRIEKSYKGLPGQQEITVVTPGGQVGDIHQETVGVPDFTEGGEHVVFVRNSSEGPTVLYFDQGTYDVKNDERGRRIVAPVASDAVHVDTQRGQAVQAEEPKTLDEFESSVNAAEKRALNRMELLRKEQEKQQTSLGAILKRNRFLIALALIGAALATWQFFRR
jgi:hypothetical protein